MGITDPIADMLTQIRNAIQAKHKEVEVTGSLIKVGIVDVLKREGYIKDYKFEPNDKQGIIKIYFKPVPVIQGVQRVSKPGRKVYTRSPKIPRVTQGFGITILTTPQGILSDKEARKAKVGGEILAKVW